MEWMNFVDESDISADHVTTPALTSSSTTSTTTTPTSTPNTTRTTPTPTSTTNAARTTPTPTSTTNAARTTPTPTSKTNAARSTLTPTSTTNATRTTPTPTSTTNAERTTPTPTFTTNATKTNPACACNGIVAAIVALEASMLQKLTEQSNMMHIHSRQQDAMQMKMNIMSNELAHIRSRFDNVTERQAAAEPVHIEELESVIQLDDIPEKHSITSTELYRMASDGRSARNLGLHVTQRLFPELFGPNNLRFGYNWAGNYGKQMLDPVRKQVLTQYVQRYYTNQGARGNLDGKVIEAINEGLRRPVDKQRKKNLKTSPAGTHVPSSPTRDAEIQSIAHTPPSHASPTLHPNSIFHHRTLPPHNPSTSTADSNFQSELPLTSPIRDTALSSTMAQSPLSDTSHTLHHSISPHMNMYPQNPSTAISDSTLQFELPPTSPIRDTDLSYTKAHFPPSDKSPTLHHSIFPHINLHPHNTSTATSEPRLQSEHPPHDLHVHHATDTLTHRSPNTNITYTAHRFSRGQMYGAMDMDEECYSRKAQPVPFSSHTSQSHTGSSPPSSDGFITQNSYNYMY